MDESTSWGPRRYATLLGVGVLHAALFSLLLMPRGHTLPMPPANAVELFFLAPADIPRIISENSRPQHLSGTVAIAITPPQLDSTSSPPASSFDGPPSEAAGKGSGVDWAAEAHRAIQAFEIRNHQPNAEIPLAISPAEAQWWPRTRHHAGDEFKTANGDWIVWISSNCYQVASFGSRSNATGETLPNTICLEASQQLRADSLD